MFSSKQCEFFTSTYFEEHLNKAASSVFENRVARTKFSSYIDTDKKVTQ